LSFNFSSDFSHFIFETIFQYFCKVSIKSALKSALAEISAAIIYLAHSIASFVISVPVPNRVPVPIFLFCLIKSATT
jgi:hypothetical protein